MFEHQNSINQFHELLLDRIRKGENEEAKEMLKNVNGIIHSVDSSGKSLLHWAVKLGNKEITEYLIDNEYNIDAQDNEGNTALMLAVEADKDYLMEVLIEANADIHITNKDGTSPLQIVLGTWNLPGRGVVRLFLDRLREECGIDKQKLVNELIDLKCPLYFVVLLKDVEITRMMLDRGCSLKARCPKIHDTALHEAVAQSDLCNVKLLIERGAPINEIGYEKEPPFCRYDVCKKDSYEKLEVLKFLIQNGASLYYPIKKTPLERLFRQGNKETVCTLVQIDGIDLGREYHDKRTALHLICINESPDTAEAIPLFRGKNFNIDAIDKKGWTALMIAASRGCVKKIQHLLDMNSNVNIRNSEGHNALYERLRGYYESLVEPPEDSAIIINLLLQYGTNVLQSQNRHCDNILQHVVMRSNFYLAEIVLARLAQMEIFGEFGIVNKMRNDIALHKEYNEFYISCLKHLDEMKTFKVYEPITLFDLLNESEQKLERIVRHQNFISGYNRLMAEKQNILPEYYVSTIHRRSVEVIKKVRLEKKAAGVIFKIIGLSDEHIVPYKILDYLKPQDLLNLVGIK